MVEALFLPVARLRAAVFRLRADDISAARRPPAGDMPGHARRHITGVRLLPEKNSLPM